MTAATIIIARWDDWVLPQDAVCEVIARVGRKHALGLTLINQSMHDEQLELALLAPNGTLTIFSKEDCKHRTIHAPLNPREGTRIEPFEAGQHFVRGVVKLTSTATPSADQQLSGGPKPSQSPQAQQLPSATPPTELPHVEPGRDVGAADVPVQRTQVKPGGPQLLSAPPEHVLATDVEDQGEAAATAAETAGTQLKKQSRKRTTRVGAQTRRATAVLNRIFPLKEDKKEGKYRDRYPDEDEMAWPDVWIRFSDEYQRYVKDHPSKYECPSPTTVKRVIGRAE